MHFQLHSLIQIGCDLIGPERMEKDFVHLSKSEEKDYL